ncbi:DUF6992 family protein [Pontibacter burrus]|uniref:DUF6992 family protein n=1 Tax=Pontibacter burrus TaxID=2704466 RepID=UPI001F38E267|nr:hypothetical protein [Pontibacter burrus]
MKKYFCLLLCLLLATGASAQPDALATFNLQQSGILRIGMFVLGGWALLNILIGSFRLMKATRNKRFFFQMNIYWNIVNLVIASAALYSLLTTDIANYTLAQSLTQHHWFKKVLYLNIGLDIAYLMMGIWLQERSRFSPKTEQLKGWGQAIVLQGLFLLVLDVVLTAMLEDKAPTLHSLIP